MKRPLKQKMKELYNLGHMYENLDKVNQNYNKAASLFQSRIRRSKITI